MGLAPNIGSQPLRIVAIALLVATVILLASRLLGFAFRYLGETFVLGCEIQLSLYQLSFLSRGHGYSPEKCWSVAVPKGQKKYAKHKP